MDGFADVDPWARQSEDERFAQDDADLERALDAQAEADEVAESQGDGADSHSAIPAPAPGQPPMSAAERRLVARITHRPGSRPLRGEQIADELDCALDRRGKPTGEFRGSAYNASMILMNDVRTHGALSMDLFTGNVRVVRPINFSSKVVARVHCEPGGENFWDDHEGALKTWLGAPAPAGGWGIRITADDMGNAVRNSAYQNARHPIYQEITSKPWDKTPRLDTVLTRWLRLDPHNAPYNAQVSRLMFVAAIARLFEPGHKFDFMPVIWTGQGVAKSTFIEAISLGHFGEMNEPKDITDAKVMNEKTAGCWFVELPELAALIGVNANTIKAKLSSKRDRARAAYSKYSEDRKRSFIMVGTTNTAMFLNDPSGNRRYWPLRVGATEQQPIDLGAVRAEIQQVYAEALWAYREMRAAQPDGDLPLFLTGEAAVIAKRLQGDASVESPEQSLAGWLKGWASDDLPEGQKFCARQAWDEYHRAREGADQAPAYGRRETLLMSSAISLVPEIRPANKARFQGYGEQRAYQFHAAPADRNTDDQTNAAATSSHDDCPF